MNLGLLDALLLFPKNLDKFDNWIWNKILIVYLRHGEREICEGEH